MTKYLKTLAFVLILASAFGSVARTQEQTPAQPPRVTAPAPPERPAVPTPLKVQVVISRYQGDKKVSTLPYSLSVNVSPRTNEDSRVNLRMGAQVPLQAANGGIQYRDVGTSIDCFVRPTGDGRFSVTVGIDDSSVYADSQVAQPGGAPAFRSFRSSTALILKDGQTDQFTAATDKVSGETVKVDVTINVVK